MALRHERLNQFLNIVARANKPRASFRLSNSHYSTSHRFILTSNLRIHMRYGRLQLTSADSRYILNVLYSKERSTPRFRYGAQVSIYMRQNEDSLMFAVGYSPAGLYLSHDHWSTTTCGRERRDTFCYRFVPIKEIWLNFPRYLGDWLSQIRPSPR